MFCVKFNTYCYENQILHKTSSPFHAQSNGMAESAVKRCKYLLQKTTPSTFDLHLLAYFNAPCSNKMASPAQLFFGRTPRIPGRPIPSASFLSEREDNNPSFSVGDRVVVQNVKTKKWNTFGVISSLRRNKHSFNIETDDGAKMVRNKKYIKKTAVQPTT